MTALRNFILPFFILALMVRCTGDRSDETYSLAKIYYRPKLNFDYVSKYPLIHPTSYFGEWSSSFPFYTSELIIKRDGTFKFHQQGCLGHSYSEGRWITNGTDIFLTSFEKYYKFSLADTSNLYFYNEHYRLEDGILYLLEQDGSKDDAAFILTKSL
jgi:hypothetical protein